MAWITIAHTYTCKSWVGSFTLNQKGNVIKMDSTKISFAKYEKKWIILVLQSIWLVKTGCTGLWASIPWSSGTCILEVWYMLNAIPLFENSQAMIGNHINNCSREKMLWLLCPTCALFQNRQMHYFLILTFEIHVTGL